MHRYFHGALALFLLVLPACALAQAVKPLEVAPVIHADKPYGVGSYTSMLFDVYDAALWTDASVWSWDTPFAISMQYHMHLSAEEMAQRSLTQMEAITPFTDADRERYARQFVPMFHEVHDGDVITVIYVPKKGAVFYHNGQRSGQADESDAQRFLSIWLSERTPNPALRAGLLRLQ